ncbi:MAG: thiosulfate oxidation carrier complex protein SoxZ [Candidatus Rokubacteria bacterium]|nr:thiosulfate oxidation carrier complex protein SoxZ [Candidatus Rokubacteria bacterium]
MVEMEDTSLSRREFLIGLGVALSMPRPLGAQSNLELDHRLELDLPILSEDPKAVPVQVWVDHPMEPDHFIRSIEMSLPTDPVSYKGKFLFTPANGRAWVGFQMRSGSGGLVKAVAECSRHGRFVGSREIRVVEGGCSTAPERVARDRLGNAMLRLPRSIKAGEIVEVRTKVDHNSHTGLALKNGKFVRVAPEFYIKQMLVYLDDNTISEFQMTSAVSPNPLIRFPLKAIRSGTLRVLFVNSEGQRWEVSQPLRV